MALNTIEEFNLKGSKIVELYNLILGLQGMHRAANNVKIMMADNTDNLQDAVEIIYSLPAYETDPETTLAASYSLSAYRLTIDQVPPRMTVNQVRSIRPFINVNA